MTVRKTTGGSKPVLLLAMGTEGIDVALVGKVFKHSLVRGHSGLIEAVALLLPPPRRPGGIVVSGQAVRFSESRSVATVANTLAFAWDVPLCSVKSLPGKPAPDILLGCLRSAKGYLMPAYSGKPNITKPKVRP